MFGLLADGIAVGVASNRMGLYVVWTLCRSKEGALEVHNWERHGRWRAERTRGEIRDIVES